MSSYTTSQQLFQLPVPSTNGKLTCFQPADRVYVLEFASPPDNRLNTDFCQAFLLALDILETRHKPGVLLTTSSIPKFYSNGLDLHHALSTPFFFPDSCYALWRRILTFPMPTIAVINGHAFAGALMTAMMHDYRIMNPAKGFLCLNELDFGVPLRPPMSSIFRQKLAASTYRDMVLEAKRFGAQDALREKIVDGLGGMDEAMALVADRKLVDKPATGVYGHLKAEMWRETVGYLSGWTTESMQQTDLAVDGRSDREKAERNVKAWELKAKL